MYCQLHRPVTSGSQLACFLGHVGDRIYWIQKDLWLPDALGVVPPPYFPILHVGITGLVSVLLFKAVIIDALEILGCLTALRGRKSFSGSGQATFFKRWLRGVLLAFFEVFVISSSLNIMFLILYRNNDIPTNGDENPELYSQIMRNKLNRYKVIF